MSPPARARAPRRKPHLEEPEWPEIVVDVSPTLRRRVGASNETDPERARWVSLVLTDPAGARRERLEARARYWRARLAQHEARLAAIREQLDAALYPSRDVRQVPVPAAEIWRLRCEFAATWADAQAARAELAALEAELAGLAQA